MAPDEQRCTCTSSLRIASPRYNPRGVSVGSARQAGGGGGGTSTNVSAGRHQKAGDEIHTQPVAISSRGRVTRAGGGAGVAKATRRAPTPKGWHLTFVCGTAGKSAATRFYRLPHKSRVDTIGNRPRARVGESASVLHVACSTTMRRSFGAYAAGAGLSLSYLVFWRLRVVETPALQHSESDARVKRICAHPTFASHGTYYPPLLFWHWTGQLALTVLRGKLRTLYASAPSYGELGEFPFAGPTGGAHPIATHASHHPTTTISARAARGHHARR